MKKPQVLLLGNGINRAFNANSWTGFLKSISKQNNFKIEDLSCPMIMQPILLTNDCIDQSIKDKQGELWGDIETEECKTMYQELLQAGFDDIITTNYSYELELSIQKENILSKNKVKHMATSITGKRLEPKYTIHTYNKINFNEKKNRVWHIHGEARKPSSVILGQYYYVSFVAKVQEYVRSICNRYLKMEKEKQEYSIESWIDSFILGDVYVLGFGFDYAEIDLWYLLQRKKRERADHGKVYFYEPKEEQFNEKYALLEVMNVKIEHLGYKDIKDEEYLSFYKSAIGNIKNKVGKEK